VGGLVLGDGQLEADVAVGVEDADARGGAGDDLLVLVEDFQPWEGGGGLLGCRGEGDEDEELVVLLEDGEDAWPDGLVVLARGLGGEGQAAEGEQTAGEDAEAQALGRAAEQESRHKDLRTRVESERWNEAGRWRRF